MPIVGYSLSKIKPHISRQDLAHPDHIKQILENLKEDETPPDFGKPTRWLLGALPSRVLSRIKDTSVEQSRSAADGDNMRIGIQYNQFQYATLVCRFGLKGWSDFYDDDGKEIVYATEEFMYGGQKYVVVKGELLDKIPFPVLLELSQEIEAFDLIKEADAKN